MLELVIYLSAELGRLPPFFSTDRGGRSLIVIGATANHFAHQERGGVMKGKRKAKTSKWAMRFQFKTEAQRSISARSEKASNRFLDAALHLGSAHEPLGRLAGASFEHHTKSPELPELLTSVINIVCKAGQPS